jgi:hypothetical protein
MYFDRLLVSVGEDGINRTLQREFRYHDKESGKTVTAYAGFNTDFASIPRILWRIAPPATGRYIWAAVIHDYIYRTADVNITRKEADKIFLNAMIESGVNPFLRQAMYRSVRLGGGSSFVERQSTFKVKD